MRRVTHIRGRDMVGDGEVYCLYTYGGKRRHFFHYFSFCVCVVGEGRGCLLSCKRKKMGWLSSVTISSRLFYDSACSCLYWSLIWLLVCCFHLILSAYFFVWGETFCFWVTVSGRCRLLSWEWVCWSHWCGNRQLRPYLCPFPFSTSYDRPVSFFLLWLPPTLLREALDAKPEHCCQCEVGSVLCLCPVALVFCLLYFVLHHMSMDSWVLARSL